MPISNINMTEITSGEFVMQKVLGIVFLSFVFVSTVANAEMFVCKINTAMTTDGVSTQNLSDISKTQMEISGVAGITKNLIVHIDRENIEAVLQNGETFLGSPFKIKFYGKNIITAVGETETCQESIQLDKINNVLLFGMLCLHGSDSSWAHIRTYGCKG